MAQETVRTRGVAVRAALQDHDEIADFGLFWMTDEGIATNVETLQSVDIEVDETLFTNELLEEL